MADNELRSISPEKRNCYFQDETQSMKLHKYYSQANCLLECSLNFAQKALSNNTDSQACTPWYFPFKDKGHKICDPWETENLTTLIALKVYILKTFSTNFFAPSF